MYTTITTLRLRQEEGALDFFLYGKDTEKLPFKEMKELEWVRRG